MWRLNTGESHLRMVWPKPRNDINTCGKSYILCAPYNSSSDNQCCPQSVGVAWQDTYAVIRRYVVTIVTFSLRVQAVWPEFPLFRTYRRESIYISPIVHTSPLIWAQISFHHGPDYWSTYSNISRLHQREKRNGALIQIFNKASATRSSFGNRHLPPSGYVDGGGGRRLKKKGFHDQNWQSERAGPCLLFILYLCFFLLQPSSILIPTIDHPTWVAAN